MSDKQDELKKEFELERMILFSDAVFAIAITLLIIEIKFPEVEKGASTREIVHVFKPVIIRFLGFMLSFLFIGVMWTRHLKIFKYLQTYNDTVIFRNLVFLFFIVCFPFTASGLTENIRPGFYLPVFIYIINIACVTASQFWLCSYLFRKRSNVSVTGFETEKKYLFLQSKFVTISLWTTIAVMFILSFIFKGDSIYIFYCFYIPPLMMAFSRRYLKKYKPIKVKANVE